ncbi:MAG: hypothetical protein AABX86_01370 [Nanoarchaeota archaeon]
MQYQKNFINLFLYRVGFFIATFLLLIFLHQQLAAYQQAYIGYLVELQALQPAVIENTANMEQLERVIDAFGSTTNYYLTLIFGVIPFLIFCAYLLFESFFWKTFLSFPFKRFFWRFAGMSAVGMLFIVGLFWLFWNIFVFENYTFDPRLLWIPVILGVLHYFFLLAYCTLAWEWKILPSALWRGIRKGYVGFPFSLAVYVPFLISWYSFFVVYTHYEQHLVRASTYVSSVVFLLSIAAGIFFTRLFFQHFFLRYFSIKK